MWVVPSRQVSVDDYIANLYKISAPELASRLDIRPGARPTHNPAF